METGEGQTLARRSFHYCSNIETFCISGVRETQRTEVESTIDPSQSPEESPYPSDPLFFRTGRESARRGLWIESERKDPVEEMKREECDGGADTRLAGVGLLRGVGWEYFLYIR